MSGDSVPKFEASSADIDEPLRPGAPDPDAPEPIHSLTSSGERMTMAAEVFTDGDSLVTLDPVGSTERYELGEILGEGGMGEVRLCEDQRLRRQVAMKVMRKDRATAPHLRARFFREAIAQGQLEHPAIVPVYDLGTDEKGGLYFTMRRVVGATLEEIVKALASGNEGAGREYTRNKLLAAFGNACLAVHYAHTRSVFHCDLKPANIMLGSYGEVYVLDWGLATRAGDGGSRSGPGLPGIGRADPKTLGSGNSSTVSGTPGYMAPEQIRGQPFDARADVYALGAILFELLTWKTLHEGKDARSLCLATLEGANARPSVRSPEREIPPELEAICVKATALEARYRYASARALHDDLQGYLEGDRDLHLRRTMSREHATRAAALAQRSREGDETSRSLATRTVGRALALDPDNPEALATLIELLTEPPRETPAEAIEDINATERAFDRVRRKAGAVGFAAWLLFVPLMIVHGIRSMPMFLVSTGAWLSASVLHVVLRQRRDGYGTTALACVGAVAIGTSSLVLGPNILTPTLASIYGVTTALAMDRRRRYLPIVLSCLAIVIPVLLERTGVIRASFTIHNGSWVVDPPMLVGPSHQNGGLFLANIACVVVAGFIGISFRSLLSDVQRRAHVNAWQLRQLLPKATSSLRSPSAPPMGESRQDTKTPRG
jgi:serine/threonine protein kinase